MGAPRQSSLHQGGSPKAVDLLRRAHAEWYSYASRAGSDVPPELALARLEELGARASISELPRWRRMALGAALAPVQARRSLSIAAGEEQVHEILRDSVPFYAALTEYARYEDDRGWEPACARSRAMDRLLAAAMSVLIDSRDRPDEEIQLLLRGSQAHGVLSCRSDIDFELSGPKAPNGHVDLEQRLSTLLGAAGVESEGSAGRPDQDDLHGAGGLRRDLHEWCELRRPQSLRRDPGWLAEVFSGLPPDWWARRSQYESIGRQNDGKYCFFEARALCARLALREGIGMGTSPSQLDALRPRIAGPTLSGLEACLRSSLVAYERDLKGAEVSELQDSLAGWRASVGLPGPDTSRAPGPDIRRSAPTRRTWK